MDIDIIFQNVDKTKQKIVSLYFAHHWFTYDPVQSLLSVNRSIGLGRLWTTHHWLRVVIISTILPERTGTAFIQYAQEKDWSEEKGRKAKTTTQRDSESRSALSWFPLQCSHGMWQMRTQAKISSILLLLSKYATSTDLCSMWQSQVHVEDRWLCNQTCRCVHHRNGYGRSHMWFLWSLGVSWSKMSADTRLQLSSAKCRLLGVRERCMGSWWSHL